MAERLCFVVNGDKYEEKYIDFKWVGGLNFKQRVKCADSLGESILNLYPNSKHLEISTKSRSELGISLSAFNLKLNGCCIESIYHSAKVFDDGKQYEFLKNYLPWVAKKYINEHNGKIDHFKYENIVYPSTPITAFYNWIYIKALDNSEYKNMVLDYDTFTDIEFNDKKGLNCQARATALYVAMVNSGRKDYCLSSFDNFVSSLSSFVA